MTMSKNRPEPSPHTPLAGCLILVLALAVMVFWIVFSVRVLYRQSAEIEKFTSPSPVQIPIEPTQGRETEIAALQQKICDFSQRAQKGEEVTSEWSADEINLAIAAFEPLKELRQTLRVVCIHDGKITLQISFPMNGKPQMADQGDGSSWMHCQKRFLNATMVATPQLQKNELVLQIDSIEVPGKPVPKEFLEMMSPYRITECYSNDPLISPVMKKWTGVDAGNGTLRIRVKTGEVPVDYISNQQVDNAMAKILLWIGGLATVFVLILVFVVRRSKPTSA